MKAFARAFQQVFHIPHATDRMKFAGRTDTSLVREFFAAHGIEPAEENFRRFFECYVFWLDHLLHQSRGEACRGVRDMMRAMRELPHRPALGLLTGNIRLGAEIKLRHHEMWDCFQTGAFGDDHESRNQLAAVARERGGRTVGRPLAGEEILVIGDTQHDIECGRAIGARVLAVGTGGVPLAELKTHRPDWAVEHLEELSAREVCA